MKRWILSAVGFPIALFISLFAFYIVNSRDAHIAVISHSVPTASNIATAPESATFRPEFTNLPNLEDADFPDWNERLIDTFRIGNVLRAGDVVTRSGETWLALMERNDRFELVKTRAIVKKLKTTSWPGDGRDVQLTFDRSGTNIFAVRNFKKISPGEIVTLSLKPSPDEIDRRGLDIPGMKDGDAKEFFLGEKRYELRVSKGLSLSGERLSVLILETGSERQIVYSQYYEKDMPIGNLLWVGDLDRDEKLDFYFEPFSEKGGFGASLFLSSEADRDKLVKNVAAFGVAGC